MTVYSEKRRAYQRAYYRKNRTKMLASRKAAHAADRPRKNELQREYFHRRGKWTRVPGWTKETYERALREQGGRCGICGICMAKPVRDHDHSTGQARSLLCDPCNRMLGAARDNPDTLLSGHRYLITAEDTRGNR